MLIMQNHTSQISITPIPSSKILTSVTIILKIIHGEYNNQTKFLFALRSINTDSASVSGTLALLNNS